MAIIGLVNNSTGQVADLIDQSVKAGASPNLAGITRTDADFTVDCGTAKTLVLATPVYEDINIDLSPLQTGGTAPGFATIASTNIRLRSFAVNEDVDGSLEIPHSYKLSSDITAHIHFLCDTAPTGTDYVKFSLEYYIVNADGTVSTATTIDTGDIAVDTQWKRVDADFTTAISNASLGGQMAFKIKRIAATGDAYAGECAIQTFGFHYQQDTLGSRLITTK